MRGDRRVALSLSVHRQNVVIKQRWTANYVCILSGWLASPSPPQTHGLCPAWDQFIGWLRNIELVRLSLWIWMKRWNQLVSHICMHTLSTHTQTGLNGRHCPSQILFPIYVLFANASDLRPEASKGTNTSLYVVHDLHPVFIVYEKPCQNVV